MTDSWSRIPKELQQQNQWLLASKDAKGDLKVPTSISSTGELIPGSSTNESRWLTFDKACEAARKHGLGIGYVLHFADPFTCIDLDVKNAVNYPNNPELWTKDEEIQRYTSMLFGYDTYAERSQSGQGLHLWLLGKIGAGMHRDGIEVYSQERFIACTGDVVLDRPIMARPELLKNMTSQMRALSAERQKQLDEQPEEDRDSVIFERASTAANADKFLQLCAGKWEEAGEYPSQSEADLALMSMFTFYSPSNEQCRRLFRMTELGKRKKATKDDRYLNFTLALIRERQAREKRVLDRIELNLEEQTEKMRLQEMDRMEEPAAPVVQEAASGAQAAIAVQAAPTPRPVLPGALSYPPGMAGALASFIHNSAPRPVREVAVVAALGWLAGVCGKAWYIPQSGLNLYVILVARSAIGKEAMHSGLSALTAALLDHGYVTASHFIDYSDFASGPALRKAVAEKQSFVNVSGEWGRKLRRLSADGVSDGPMQSLRTAMTDLYQKSGPQSIVGGLTYSNKDNNVASVNGVNYSMIGETTPGTFYDALTETMMEDGFLSRFTIVEYNGERPPANHSPARIPSSDLILAAGSLCSHASTLINNRTPQLVGRSKEAEQIMNAFDLECDKNINARMDESWRQMWNRAHLKSLRIAALLAVADNSAAPVITEAHMNWAIDLIKRDIKVMGRKIEDGEVGTGDAPRERKLLTMCKEYLAAVPKGYGVHDDMHAAGVVPRKYFQMRTQKLSVFINAKNGAIRALDDTLRSMCDSGYLMEVDRMKAADAYGYQGRCYRIAFIPGGLLD